MELKSIKETAKELGVCEITVRRWIKSGYIVAVRVGFKLLKISESEIERLKKGE